MPKGKTTFYFRGGPVGGEVIEEAACNRIYESLRIPSGSGFTEEGDGSVGVFTQAAALPDNWTSYKVSSYAKEEPTSGPGVVYNFTGVLMVDRCRALTKKGDWCKNESVDGSSVCKTHSRSEKVELRPS